VSLDAVLIISSDALAAALLAAAVELAGHEPQFPRSNESARDALRRVRPRLAVIDCDHVEACSDAFLGPALMTGAQLLLFASQHGSDEGTAVARRLDIDVVRLPADVELLMTRLRQLTP
jgi:DNA-binding response OmpR family regulator